MKILTVFTPTYQRGYCLHQVYESLIVQTEKNFIWLIIDDGSTDDTFEKVKSWQNENKIEINYIFQQNQGMHGAHNTAYENISTEFNVCIDSDDFMPKDAVEKIIFWTKKLNTKLAGIIALDSYKNGEIIGTKMPEDLNECTVNELYLEHGVKGDKKLVYRTEVVKKYPKYPIFTNENFVPLGMLYLLIDQDYKVLPLNEIICIVEYQDDGSTKNILRQYRRNPRGFAFSRLSRIKYSKDFKTKFNNSIHLVSSAIFLKDLKLVFKSSALVTTLLAIPLGVILNLYIRYKTKINL